MIFLLILYYFLPILKISEKKDQILLFIKQHPVLFSYSYYQYPSTQNIIQIKKVLASKNFFTAAGRTRTGTVLPAWFWVKCVCQFRHSGKLIGLAEPFIIISCFATQCKSFFNFYGQIFCFFCPPCLFYCWISLS